MRAARWDTVWEAGGLWRRVLRWRLGTDPDAPAALLGATRMELWPANTVPSGPPTMTITGELAGDNRSVTLALTAEETTAAAATVGGPRRFRHRVLVHDPALDDDRVLLRGFVTVGPPEASP